MMLISDVIIDVVLELGNKSMIELWMLWFKIGVYGILLEQVHNLLNVYFKHVHSFVEVFFP